MRNKYMVCFHAGRIIGYYATEAGAICAAIDMSLQDEARRAVNVYPIVSQDVTGMRYGTRSYVAQNGRGAAYRAA